jgi:hypothetical protein
MKRIALLVVLMGLVATSGAWAQYPMDDDPGAWSAHQLGMGVAGIALADGARAWNTNPAGLSRLDLPAQDSSWSGVIDATYMHWESNPVYDVNYSGFNANSNTGFGLGISRVPGGWNMQGFGVGTAFRGGPVSFGINYKRLAPGGGFVSYGLGGLYRGKCWNFGIMVDNFNEATFISPGIAFGVGKRLLLALDVNDLTSQFLGPYYSYGAEYKLNPSWAVRAGRNDTLFFGTGTCFGLGYKTGNWHADAGYRALTGFNAWSVGAGLNF